jgi:hypothetical protein
VILQIAAITHFDLQTPSLYRMFLPPLEEKMRKNGENRPEIAWRRIAAGRDGLAL